MLCEYIYLCISFACLEVCENKNKSSANLGIGDGGGKEGNAESVGGEWRRQRADAQKMGVIGGGERRGGGGKAEENQSKARERDR